MAIRRSQRAGHCGHAQATGVGVRRTHAPGSARRPPRRSRSRPFNAPARPPVVRAVFGHWNQHSRTGASTMPAGHRERRHQSPSHRSADDTFARLVGEFVHALAPDGWGSGRMVVPATVSAPPTTSARGTLPANASMASLPTEMMRCGATISRSRASHGAQRSRSAGLATRSPRPDDAGPG